MGDFRPSALLGLVSYLAEMGNTCPGDLAAGKRQSLLQMAFGRDLGSHTESRDPKGAGDAMPRRGCVCGGRADLKAEQRGEERGLMLAPQGREDGARTVVQEAVSEIGRAGPGPEMEQVACSADRAPG